MGNADWSLGQLEHDLAAGFDMLARAERVGALGQGESSALADGVLRCMNGALMKVSESLEVQSHLRRELADVRNDFLRVQTEQAERIRGLEGEVVSLRQALADERARVQGMFSRLPAGGPAQQPSDEYLARPFVIRSQQGDFLGVTDRSGQALSLSGFLRLVDGPADPGGAMRAPGRLVATCWEGGESAWSLTVSVISPAARKHYFLETQSLRTPSGNLVTLLADLNVDGKTVPQDFVVQMFRQLRDSLQEN